MTDKLTKLKFVYLNIKFLKTSRFFLPAFTTKSATPGEHTCKHHNQGFDPPPHGCKKGVKGNVSNYEQCRLWGLDFHCWESVSASFITLLELESPWAGGKEMRFGGERLGRMSQAHK